MLKCCRYLALVYAVGLAIAETMLNTSFDQWQYAPMWIIDYLVVSYLADWNLRVAILMSAYAFSAGVMYIVFFQALDPDLPEAAQPHRVVLALLGLVFGISVIGSVGTTTVWLRQEVLKSPAFYWNMVRPEHAPRR